MQLLRMSAPPVNATRARQREGALGARHVSLPTTRYSVRSHPMSAYPLHTSAWAAIPTVIAAHWRVVGPPLTEAVADVGNVGTVPAGQVD